MNEFLGYIHGNDCRTSQVGFLGRRIADGRYMLVISGFVDIEGMLTVRLGGLGVGVDLAEPSDGSSQGTEGGEDGLSF